MKRIVVCLIALLAVAALIGRAEAERWIFGRSYYSQTPPRPIVVGQQRAAGGPYYSRPQGEYTTSSLRYLRIRVLAFGGRSIRTCLHAI